MKCFRKLLSLALAIGLVAGMLPGRAAAAGGMRSVNTEDEFLAALNDETVQTIELAQNIQVGLENTSTDIPLIIQRDVTIRGSSLSVGRGGIILGGDVTFEDIELNLINSVYFSLLANGHTLTLNNVARSTNMKTGLSAFCGGLEGTDYELPTPGTNGAVIINNSEILDVFAGSLFPKTGGSPSSRAAGYSGNSRIELNGAKDVSSVNIYASGGASASGGVFAPVGNYADYPVSGGVTISLVKGTASVNGQAASNNFATVVYSGGGNEGTPSLQNIARLEVQSGNLKPSELTFGGDNACISVESGARLNLAALGSAVTINDFSGGGQLVLGASQTLTITGNVSDSTQVGIGGFQSDGISSNPVSAERVYIQAPNSMEDSFMFEPASTQSNWALQKDDAGNWSTVKTGEDDREVIEDFSIVDRYEFDLTTLPDGEVMYLEIDMEVSPADSMLENIPITITVNGDTAEKTVDGDVFSKFNLLLYIAGSTLCISPAEFNKEVPVGNYNIALTVPGEYTTSKQPITRSVILTIRDGASLIPIEVPQAVAGLKYNGMEQVGVQEGVGYTLEGHKQTEPGSYFATATLVAGYQWMDGSTDPKSIPWSIAEAAPEPVKPAAPSGLAGFAPSTENGSDGKITGTTSAMEYATAADSHDWTDCTDGETTGLAAGTYYVRVKAQGIHPASDATEVVVPDYVPPEEVASIELVVGENAKKVYGVGDALDVTGLTLKVTKTDGTAQEVAVTAEMVSGFNSSAAAESQELTVTYQGKTAVFTIKIVEKPVEPPVEPPVDPPVDPVKYAVTVSGSYATESGAGKYEKGALVTVSSGAREGYTFARWTGDGEDVAFANATQLTTTFTMPERAVAVTANWTKNSSSGGSSGGGSSGGGSSGGGSSRPSRPSGGGSSGGSSGGSKPSMSTPPTTPVVTPPVNPAPTTPQTGAASTPFSDVPGDAWYAKAVEYAYQHGLMSGTGGASFSPERPATRGQLVSILYRLEGSPTVGGNLGFPDTAEDAYYADAVRWATQNSIVGGYANGSFGPADPITTEQLCAFLYRYARFKGDLTTAQMGFLSGFADQGEISDYAAEPLAWAVGQGIVSGTDTGLLMPKNKTTRAQTAMVLMQLRENVL